MGHFKGKIGNAHAWCHVTGWYGVIQNHIFGISNPNLPIHCTTFMGLQRRLGGVYTCKAVLGRKFCPGKSGPKMAVFQELRDVNVKFLFSNPEKAHACTVPRRLTHYAWKSVWGPWLWSVGRTPHKKRSRV